MKRRIKIYEALGFAGISSIASFLFFLMISVFFAQIIVDYILTKIVNSPSILIGIVIGGFALGLVVSMLISILTTKSVPYQYIWSATFLSFVLNLIIWVMISYVGLWIRYPTSVNTLYAWELLLTFPELIATFGIYVVKPDVTWLWLYGIITYTLLYGVFLYWLGSPYDSTTKKIKRRLYAYD